jgi:hypothetical protein
VTQRNPLYSFGPYPELVEPERGATPYRIEDSRGAPHLPAPGMVDLGKRILWAPLDAWSRAVMRHELGHVRWSRPLGKPLPFDPRIFMSVEDARVNLGLARLCIPVVLDAESHAHVAMLAARDAKDCDAFPLFMRGIASVGTSVAAELRRRLRDEPGPFGARAAAWMDRVERELGRARAAQRAPVAPLETALELARQLARELRALGLLDAELQARSKARTACCVVESASGMPPAFREGRAGHRPSDEEGAAVEPGRLSIERAPLCVPLRARGGMRGWRASPEGSAVRYVHRWTTDGAIFRRRTRKRGGTILVDVSGSMSLEPEALDGLLLATPPGTCVAVYSGSEDRGTLRIVAEGTHRAAAEHLKTPGRGNIVDLPALEWLARQPQPRVWVTDGGVTGIGDRPSKVLGARCRALRQRARIQRVAKLAQAAELLGAPKSRR